MALRRFVVTKTVADLSSDSLQRYIRDVHKEPLIDPKEEATLLHKVGKGERCATERLIKGNLRFVISVAKQYQGQGLPLADLISEGNIGLVKAASRFDESRGFKFISFAVWWVRQSIMQALSEHGRMIRVPSHKVVLIGKARAAGARLEQDLGREADVDEVAECIGADNRDLHKLLLHAVNPESLDAPLNEDSGMNRSGELRDVNAHAADVEVEYYESMATEIKLGLSQLSTKQQHVLTCLFGLDQREPLSLRSVASMLNVSTERVKQIKYTALDKLRRGKNDERLRNFLS